MIQLQVLNKIIQDRDPTIITLNNLTADYFSDYKQEFWFIKNHLDEYGNIPDSTTFLSKFPNFEYIEIHESLNYLLEELTKDKNKRFIAEKFNEIRNAIMRDDIESAQKIVMEAAEQSSSAVSLQCVDIIHDTSRYDRYLDRVENLDKYFITTGFKELDAIIAGWDCNEDLVTIVARNGLGKSWILFRCAASAAVEGKRVGIYSGEMSEDSVGYRVDTLLGNISNGALMHGGVSVKNEYKKFLDELQTTVPGELYVLTPKMINGPATVSALRAFVEKYNLDILFVDQHSLLDDDRKAKDKTEKASNISKDLKLLQTVKRIPVICVSQQNRETTESGNFDTTQIAMSDRIGQDSSVVLFIERKDDLLKLHLVKSRNSGCGQVLTYRVDLNKGIFQFIPDEKDTQQAPGTSDVSSYQNYSEDEVF